jgi:hypothetical protein
MEPRLSAGRLLERIYTTGSGYYSIRSMFAEPGETR